jgi:hypothetical protein
VIAMPVLPRRRHEVRQTIEKLKRRELDDTIGTGPRGLAANGQIPATFGGFREPQSRSSGLTTPQAPRRSTCV